MRKQRARPALGGPRVQGRRERPPVFGRWSAQAPLGCASGSLPPTLRQSELANDVDVRVVVDIDDDTFIDAQRDRVASENAYEFVDCRDQSCGATSRLSTLLSSEDPAMAPTTAREHVESMGRIRAMSTPA